MGGRVDVVATGDIEDVGDRVLGLRLVFAARGGGVHSSARSGPYPTSGTSRWVR
ncbi:hypothetical protein [Streptomyces canus]|uniref:hypothetical protein n=1 Tax=Streptomyces canus TaxID=58343 RepID=UPI002DD7ADA8|nr:hypothetical protein [Streptomyces canus]WSD92500.1 hypothetical protein OG925_24905 [Streptomyces canus]